MFYYREKIKWDWKMSLYSYLIHSSCHISYPLFVCIKGMKTYISWYSIRTSLHFISVKFINFASLSLEWALRCVVYTLRCLDSIGAWKKRRFSCDSMQHKWILFFLARITLMTRTIPFWFDKNQQFAKSVASRKPLNWTLEKKVNSSLRASIFVFTDFGKIFPSFFYSKGLFHFVWL